MIKGIQERVLKKKKKEGEKDEKRKKDPEGLPGLCRRIYSPHDVQPRVKKKERIIKSKKNNNNTNNIILIKSKGNATTHCLDARKVTKRMSIVILR